MDEEIEPDDLCPLKAPNVIEETFLRTMKQLWIWSTTGRKTNEDYCCTLFIIMGSKYESGNTGARSRL